MRIPTLAILAVGAASLFACSSPESGSSFVTVTDSAGVEIVTHSEAALTTGASWGVSSIPIVGIGEGAGPQTPLLRIVAVTPLGEGQVAVGTAVPPEVLIFGSGGNLLRRLGRAGDGPGEFITVASVVRLARDTVAVWDPYRRRVSIYATDGNLGHELDLSTVAPIAAGNAGSTAFNSGYTRLLRTSSGDLVLFGEGAIGTAEEPGVVRPTLPTMRISRQGEMLGEYGSFPGMEVVLPSGLPRPLAKRTYGTTVGEGVLVGTGEAEVRQYGPSGLLERIVRWPDGDRTVTGPHLSRWTDFVAEQPEMAEMIAALPRADRFPAHAEILGSPSGPILVSDYPGPLGVWPLRREDDAPEPVRPRIRVPARPWSVYNTDGRMEARLETPEGFEPYSLSGDTIWGVFTDELDVESVRAYHVIRGESK